MIFVNIFTYKGDEEIVSYAARSAKLVFGDECEVNVIDDSNNPIGQKYKDILKEHNIQYRTSTFNRNHNLNGKECCVGILEEIVKSTNGDKTGISIKLDSDTLIFKRALFDAFIKDDQIAYMASNRPQGVFSGICYCIKNNILDKCLKNMKAVDIDLTIAPEDVAIGCIAVLSGFPKSNYIIPGWNDVTKTGESCGWLYKNANRKEIFAKYYELFTICTVGNWFLTEGLKREDRNIVMEGLFSQISEN